MTIHRPYAESSGADGDLVSLTPEDAGWEWTGLRVVRLSPGQTVRVETGPSEVFVLAAAWIGAAGGRRTRTSRARPRRSSTWTVGPASSARSPTSPTSDATAWSPSSPTASPSWPCPPSRCSTRLEARYGAASDVPVETRGAGRASRQVNNFGVPGVWDHAEKLIAVELVTPPGNWSSYPPHKHDASEPCEVVNEEIYYYRIAGADQVTPSRDGHGYHRTYTGPEHDAAGLEALDETFEVHDHDVVLIPHGYHGPCMASTAYPMYYLNVMAGPHEDRSMAFCDDPTHAWIRDSWTGVEVDSRCPVTSADGRADGLVPSYDDDAEEIR